MCGGGLGRASTVANVRRQSSSVSPAPPKIRSRFQVSNPAAAHGRRHACRGVGHVAAAQPGQHVGVGGLQAEGDPGDPGGAVGAEMRVVGVLGVALDGHLGVGGAGDGVENPAEGGGGQARRGAASEEDAGGGGRGRRPAPAAATRSRRRRRSAP